MAEIIGAILALLTIFWVRKQDRSKIIADENSHQALRDSILFPENRFQNRIKKIEYILNNTLEKGLDSTSHYL